MTFYVLIGHLYVFFGEMSFKVLCPCLNWVVFFFVVVVVVVVVFVVLEALYISWLLSPF